MIPVGGSHVYVFVELLLVVQAQDLAGAGGFEGGEEVRQAELQGLEHLGDVVAGFYLGAAAAVLVVAVHRLAVVQEVEGLHQLHRRLVPGVGLHGPVVLVLDLLETVTFVDGLYHRPGILGAEDGRQQAGR